MIKASVFSMLCVVLAATATLTTVAADPTFTYPKCNTAGDTSKCCTLSSKESMSNRGYFRANVNGASTVVTCKAGKLECHLGNPMLRATTENYTDVDCPDFSALFESRSGLEILEGVVAPASETTDDVSGQVKPAEA